MKRQAFALIEILIVISILSILSTLITVTVPAQLRKARDARRKLDINSIYKPLEEYYDSANCYPQSLPSCNGQGINIGQTSFLQSLACDPKTKNSYIYVSDDTDCSSWFQLYANLENTDDRIIDLLGCQNGCGPDCKYNYGVSSPNKDLERCTPTPPPQSPTPSITSGPSPTPTPTPLQYVCSPASGPMPEGRCEPYAVPTLSQCPKIYPNDPTCNYECSVKANRCKTAKGKYKPQ